jgi:hypothetical protein
MFSEGLEESYQFIVAEEGKRMGDIYAGLVDPDETTLGERLSKYSKESELHTSALFGALGGGLFSAAGPKTTQLVNKAFRKGEMRMTIEDVRKREAQDRFTRLAHGMDMINQAAATGDQEAIFSAKANLAFAMANEAVTANNYDQARAAMAQIKNATKEEQEAYDIKENFPEFVEGIDEWIKHMDAAADIVDRAKSKFTYGLSDMVASRKFEKYMIGVQKPRVREAINAETAQVVTNLDRVSKDGNSVVEMSIDSQGTAMAIKAIEQEVNSGRMTAKEVILAKEQIEQWKERINNTRESISEIVDAKVLTEEDDLAISAIEGGSADSVTSLAAKEKIMEYRDKKNTVELNLSLIHI